MKTHRQGGVGTDPCFGMKGTEQPPYHWHIHFLWECLFESWFGPINFPVFHN